MENLARVAREVLQALGWDHRPRRVRVFASGPSLKDLSDADWKRLADDREDTLHVALNWGNVCVPEWFQVDVSVFLEDMDGWIEYPKVAEAIIAHDGVLATTTEKPVRRQVGTIDPCSARLGLNSSCGACSAGIHLAWLLATETVELFGVDNHGTTHASGNKTYFAGSARAQGWDNARLTMELFIKHLYRSDGHRALIQHSPFHQELTECARPWPMRPVTPPPGENHWSLVTILCAKTRRDFEHFWAETAQKARAAGAQETLVVISDDDPEQIAASRLAAMRSHACRIVNIRGEPLDFGRLRRDALAQVQTPWAFCLDPDETIDDLSWEALARIMMDPIAAWDVCYFPTLWLAHVGDAVEPIPGPGNVPFRPVARLARTETTQFAYAFNELWLSAKNAPAYCGGVEIQHHCYPDIRDSWAGRDDELKARSEHYSTTGSLVSIPDFDLWRIGAPPFMVAMADGHAADGGVIIYPVDPLPGAQPAVDHEALAGDVGG